MPQKRKKSGGSMENARAGEYAEPFLNVYPSIKNVKFSELFKEI